MLARFEKSPFVYDIMLNGIIDFKEENIWTLSFPSGKEFYQIPAQNKLKELSEAASNLSGRTIQIVLAENKLASSAPVAKTVVKPATKKTTATKQTVISDEEPFATGPFDNAEEGVVSAQDTPEEVKEILDMFPGDLLA